MNQLVLGIQKQLSDLETRISDLEEDWEDCVYWNHDEEDHFSDCPFDDEEEDIVHGNEKIQKVVEDIFKTNNIRTKKDLDNYGRENLYELTESRAPKHWTTLKNPKASVRAHYQKLIDVSKK